MKKRYIIPSAKVHKIQLASMLMEFSKTSTKVIGEGDKVEELNGEVDMNGDGTGLNDVISTPTPIP